MHSNGLSKGPARVLATEEEEFDNEYWESHELKAQGGQRVHALYRMLREVHHRADSAVDEHDEEAMGIFGSGWLIS